MEENKSKKSGGVPLILVIAILIIALLGCITYIMKNNEKQISINNDNSDKTINELRTEVSNLKNTLEQEKSKVNIIELNSIIKKLDIIDGIEFSDISELKNEQIYERVLYYFYKNGEDINNISKSRVKDIIKDTFNIQYTGEFRNIEFGDGDSGRYASVLKVEEINGGYKVYYSLIQVPQSDEPDYISKNYVAEILITENGQLYVGSNKSVK